MFSYNTPKAQSSYVMVKSLDISKKESYLKAAFYVMVYFPNNLLGLHCISEIHE